MNFKHLLLGFFILLSLSIFSQNKNYTDGFVILKDSKDTIFGKIKNMGVQKSCWKLKFLDKNDNKVNFKKSDVFAYKRGDDLYFTKKYERPITMDKMLGYMKLVADGKIKLSLFKYEKQSMNMMNGGVSHSNTNYYIEKEGEFFLVKATNFKKKMLAFLSDDNELVNKIKNKKLKYDDLEKIVKTYNLNHQ